jgi:hypothetical protein
MKPQFKIIKATHLTPLDRKLINTSIANNLQDVSTQQKRFNIICQDAEGIIKAYLYSFEVGIGINSRKEWRKREIQFKILNS